MAGLYAQEPLFVVTFWWGGLGFGFDINKPYVRYCTSYAYRELVTEEFPIAGGFAYGFLKSLTGFDTQMQIDGFGQVNQLSAEFVDYFGHFRYWMASRNIYTEIMVEVGLYFRNPQSMPDVPLKGTIYKIFEGKIREPVVWNEADRTFKCDFVSDTWFKNVGYVPAIQDIILQRFVPDPPAYQDGQQINVGEGEYKPYIDTERLLLQQNINEQVWPQLFGRALEIPLRPIAKVPEFTIVDNVPCIEGWGQAYRTLVREAFIQNNEDLIPIFDNALLVLPLDENNDFFMAIERDYINFQYKWPEYPANPYQERMPEEGIPVVLNNYQSMDLFLPARMMTVDIETEGETIRCAGYLIDRFFVIPAPAGDVYKYFNIPTAQFITCTKVHQCYQNPDFLDWLDFNSPQAVGKLTPDQRAFAAGSAPPQWVERPDYEPNLLRLQSTTVSVATAVPPSSNPDQTYSELEYDKFYKEDYNIETGWYFVYNGNVYVVCATPGARLLHFTPPMPDDFSIPKGTQLDFCHPDTPWLQNQFIALNVHFKWPIYNTIQATKDGKPIWLNSSGNLTLDIRDNQGNLNLPYYQISGYKERDDVLYARVSLQLGPKLYIENMVNTYGMDASKWLMSPNTTVNQITTVTGNLRLMPRSMDMRIQDIKQIGKAMNRVGDQRRLYHVNSNKKTAYMKRDYNDISTYYTIRVNSKVRVIDWWASHTYVLTTEIGQDWENVYPDTLLPLWYFRVYLENVWGYINGRPVPLLGPKSGQVGESRGYLDHYRRNDYFELHPELFFIPTYRDPGEMNSYYGGVYYPSRTSQILQWPNHVSITLYATPFVMMLQALAANGQEMELFANACNTLNSDEKIFKAVLENHTTYFYDQAASLPTSTGYPYDPQQLTFEHQAMGVVTESIDAREFLAQLAFENAKHIQIRGNHAMLIDFFKAYNPMIIFDADNIDAKSISFEYVPFEDLITQYNITLANGKKWAMKGQTPFGPFDYTTLKNLSIGRDLDSWKPKDIKIQFNQTFRPDDFNLLEPILDGYIHLSNLYPLFLLPQKLNPLQHFFGGTQVEPPNWVKNMPLWPVEWCERSISSVLHWWLHFHSRVWTVMTFKTYVDEGNMSFYLRAGDIVAIKLDGPTVKLFEDEQPPVVLGEPLLKDTGYPMERIGPDGHGVYPATNFDHSKIKYYSMNLDPAPGEKWCSGRALVLSTSLDPEEWLITVKVLLPIAADGGY